MSVKRNFFMFGRLFGRWGIIYNIRHSIKFFIQRGRKGYCDKDLWEIDTWFSQTVSRMMKEFSKKNLAYPEVSDTICPGYNEMSAEEKYRKWTELTYQIGVLLEKSGYNYYPYERDEEQILSKDKAFDLLRDNFYDLFW